MKQISLPPSGSNSTSSARVSVNFCDLLPDLLPTSRTSLKFVKSVTMENDGHEEEQIYRLTDHWFLEASRGRHADQGVVPQWRL
jgi:hypothetical protein